MLSDAHQGLLASLANLLSEIISLSLLDIDCKKLSNQEI